MISTTTTIWSTFSKNLENYFLLRFDPNYSNILWNQGKAIVLHMTCVLRRHDMWHKSQANTTKMKKKRFQGRGTGMTRKIYHDHGIGMTHRRFHVYGMAMVWEWHVEDSTAMARPRHGYDMKKNPQQWHDRGTSMTQSYYAAVARVPHGEDSTAMALWYRENSTAMARLWHQKSFLSFSFTQNGSYTI